MKTIGYVRVSTEDQAREGVSLDAQEAKLRAWAALNDCPAPDIFRDEGLSGKRADNRPGLQAALDATKNGAALVVYSLSRLSRSTRDTLALADRLTKQGGQLVSLTEKIDTTTAAGRMVLTVLAAMYQLEREQTGERTRDALRHIRAQGRKTGGDVPYGYQARDGRLTEHPAEQKAIRLIRKLRGKGHSFRAIAAELEREGYRTKTGKAHWHPQSVKQVLERAAA